MLRARAASVLARMEFSDVMAALDIHDYTAEELGVDIGQDLDEPAASEGGPVDEDDDGGGEVIDEAVVVEDLAPGPEETSPANSPPPTPGETPAARSAETQTAERPREHPVPRPKPGERQDVADLKYRLNLLSPDGRQEMRAWLAAENIPDSIDVDEDTVARINAELDRRGIPPIDRPAPGRLVS
jgi:hypothetical protein